MVYVLKLKFHDSSFLVASSYDTSDTPDFLVSRDMFVSDILARMSRGCYEETAPVECQPNKGSYTVFLSSTRAFTKRMSCAFTFMQLHSVTKFLPVLISRIQHR